MRAALLAVVAILALTITANARLLFQHFAGGAVSSPSSAWVSPLGSAIVYPTGTAMGSVP